jgi:hypothetical protein
VHDDLILMMILGETFQLERARELGSHCDFHSDLHYDFHSDFLGSFSFLAVDLMAMIIPISVGWIVVDLLRATHNNSHMQG